MPRKNKIFNPDQFTATEFYSAADKAKFAEQFVAFVLSGFDTKKFPKWFYQQLSNCFGHIAHFNQSGFYGHFFATPQGQQNFIDQTTQYVPVGNPAYTFSDVERAIKSWFALNLPKVNLVLRTQRQLHEAAIQAEQQRRAALQDQLSQVFVVVAKSSNIGAFGHYQYVLVAQDGSAWKVCRTCGMLWEVNQRVEVPLGHDCQPQWAHLCVECPERLPNAPQEVVDAAFKKGNEA